MKINIGSADRAIRVVLGIVLLVVLFAIDSPIRWVGLLGIVMLGTAALNFCPLYTLFGISTCKISSSGKK